EEHADQRRLAGAVRAEVPERRPAGDEQVDVADHRPLAEPLRQPRGLDNEGRNWCRGHMSMEALAAPLRIARWARSARPDGRTCLLRKKEPGAALSSSRGVGQLVRTSVVTRRSRIRVRLPINSLQISLLCCQA